MSYKVRNTLVLIVILLLVIFVSWIGNSGPQKKLVELNKKHNELEKRITNIKKEAPLINNDEQLNAAIYELEKKASYATKLIALEDNPVQTYHYLIDICSKYCPDMTFDFKPVASGKIKETSYNDYSISGKVPIQSLYSFVYQIENQPLLYTIESLNIQGQSVSEENKIDFSLGLRAYFDSTGMEVNDIPIKEMKYENISYNPFFPQIHEPLQIEEEEKYFNIDGAVLIGLSPNMAFFRESSGTIKTLSPGDKVAYGYLLNIDWKKQEVTFEINKTGITTQTTIKVKKEIK